MLTRKEIQALLPWKEPEHWMEDNGADCDVTIGDHHFTIRATGETGINSGRKRWAVTCTSCNEVVHPGSTSATAQIDMHLTRTHRP